MTIRLICIGSQKAGTQWLYDQLASHPDVWMPPIKEVRFFQDRSHVRARREAGRKLNDILRRLVRGEKADLRDIDFLRRYHFETIDREDEITESYRWLFNPSDTQFTADVSPQYATLPFGFAKTLATAFPYVRTVMIVREPMARFWSLVNMNIRHGRQQAEIASDLRYVLDFLDLPYTRSLNLQSQVIRRWQTAFGPRFRAFVFDDLVADPARFRAKLFGFARLDGNACTIAPDYNAKSGREKSRMPPEIAAHLTAHFAPERAELAAMLGGRAVRWLKLDAPREAPGEAPKEAPGADQSPI